MKKCYIAGPITGTQDFKERFAAAEEWLISKEITPVNPVTLPHDHDKEWNSYMRECIAAMMQCDTILLLENWQESDGARMENSIAEDLGFTILHQELSAHYSF